MEKAIIHLPDPPPDYVFKHRLNRLNPSKDQWGKEGEGHGGQVSYLPERIEYIKDVGNFVYYHGCPFPSKTVAPVEAIYAIVPIKRRLINTLKILSLKEGRLLVFGLLLTRKKSALINKILSYFNEEAYLTAAPWYQDGYYCKIVKEIQAFTRAFLISFGIDYHVASDTAETVGLMFEYDNAYRYRIHDLFNETNREALLKSFPKEIERLFRIYVKRDTILSSNQRILHSFKVVSSILKYAWKVPALKRALTTGINAINWDNIKMDEADIYHTLLYGDYNVQGRTIAQRIEVYKHIHGTDESKWPIRVIIQNKA